MAPWVCESHHNHVGKFVLQSDDGNVETIQTTDEHPFYVDGRGWIGAGELQVGDLVQESDGTWQSVLSSTREEFADAITVYNFEVEGDHTYFVADGVGDVDAVWVHNACGDDQILQSKGHTIKPSTAKQLSDKFGGHPKEWGKAVERLKDAEGIQGDSHGSIRGDSAYLDEDGVFRGFIENYL